MRITRLTISNHRRVPDLDVDIRRHAVFVGSNGVGKSTVLTLIDCALGATWSQLASTLDPSQLRDPSSSLVVEVRLEELEDHDVAHFADKIEVADAAPRLTVRLVGTVSPVDPERLDITRSFVKPAVSDSAVSRDDLRQIGWALLPANRSPERDLGSGRTSAVRSLFRSVALDSAEEAAIAEALAGVSAALESSPTLGTVRADLAEQLTALLPSAVHADEVKLDLPSSGSGDPLGELDVQLEKAGERASLAAQSDGLRSLSAVAVQLLARSAARILAIDEPEVHLHPRGQANLAKLLTALPGQRIVATHAPAVLAKFQPAYAISLTSDGARQLSASALVGDPKRRQHWWVEGALEPLTSDRTILVEGVSDRILVQAVADRLDLDLDRTGVTVVALHGEGNFKPAIELFGPTGFGLNLLGLVDEKEAPRPAEALGVAVTDLASHGVLTCTTDLEDEYVRSLGVPAVVDLLVRSGLFTEARITSSTGAESVSAITSADLTSFARRHKVEAATALAEGLTADQANSIAAVADLVRRACPP